MNELEVLFKRLKGIKDKWVESTFEAFGKSDKIAPGPHDEEYQIIASVINTKQTKDAFAVVLNDVIEGVMHSIMVMLDGGDELTDEFNIDLINADTLESLKAKVALHEEFIGYLIDNEEGCRDGSTINSQKN